MASEICHFVSISALHHYHITSKQTAINVHAIVLCLHGSINTYAVRSRHAHRKRALLLAALRRAGNGEALPRATERELHTGAAAIQQLTRPWAASPLLALKVDAAQSDVNTWQAMQFSCFGQSDGSRIHLPMQTHALQPALFPFPATRIELHAHACSSWSIVLEVEV